MRVRKNVTLDNNAVESQGELSPQYGLCSGLVLWNVRAKTSNDPILEDKDRRKICKEFHNKLVRTTRDAFPGKNFIIASDTDHEEEVYENGTGDHPDPHIFSVKALAEACGWHTLYQYVSDKTGNNITVYGIEIDNPLEKDW